MAQSAATEAVFLRRHGLLSGVRCRRRATPVKDGTCCPCVAARGIEGAGQSRDGGENRVARRRCLAAASAALLVALGGSSRCGADGGPVGWARAASASAAPASCGAAAPAFGGSVPCVRELELELGASQPRAGSAHGEGKGCAGASSRREAELARPCPFHLSRSALPTSPPPLCSPSLSL